MLVPSKDEFKGSLCVFTTTKTMMVHLPRECLLKKLRDVPAANVDRLRLGLVNLPVDDDPDGCAESAAVHDDARVYFEQLGDSQALG